MNKAPDAFRTISEVAEDLDIPQHVLRFWETRFAAIRPLKRGGGRRYYRPDDVDLLKGIRQLLYGQGYTIKGVQRILKDGGPRAVQDLGRGGGLSPLPMLPPARYGEEDDLVPMDAVGASDEWHDGIVADRDATDGRDGFPPARPIVLSRPTDGDAARRLRSALADLLECQRALEALKRR